MKRAAVGFRAHSGWTALIVLAVNKGVPKVLARERVHLVETFTYEFRQPYHTAEKMQPDEGRAFVSRMRTEARRLAFDAIRKLEASFRGMDTRWPVAGFCSLPAAAQSRPDSRFSFADSRCRWRAFPRSAASRERALRP
jgi:hypothetical protein